MQKWKHIIFSTFNKYYQILLGVVLGVMGIITLTRPKKHKEPTLDTEQLSGLNKNIESNNVELDDEEQKRDKIKNETLDPSLQEVADYINNRSKDK